jgi:hypothetical protein
MKPRIKDSHLDLEKKCGNLISKTKIKTVFYYWIKNGVITEKDYDAHLFGDLESMELRTNLENLAEFDRRLAQV